MERSQAVSPVPRPNEAARALLRSRAGYDPDEQVVMDYQEEFLSVPSSCAGCPRAVDVVPAEAAAMLVDFEEHMVRSDFEFWELGLLIFINLILFLVLGALDMESVFSCEDFILFGC